MIEELTLLRKVYDESGGYLGCIRGISDFEDCYVARDSDGELYLYAVRNGSRIVKDSSCWHCTEENGADTEDWDCEYVCDDDEENKDENHPALFVGVVNWDDAVPTKVSDLINGKDYRRESPYPLLHAAGSWGEWFSSATDEEIARFMTNQIGACVGQFNGGKYPDDCAALGCQHCWEALLASKKEA